MVLQFLLLHAVLELADAGWRHKTLRSTDIVGNIYMYLSGIVQGC